MPQDKKVFDLNSDAAFPDDIAELVAAKPESPKDAKQREEDIIKRFALKRSIEIGVMAGCLLIFVTTEICAWLFKLAIAWMFVGFFVPYLIWVITSNRMFRCPKCNTWLVKFREGEGGMLWKIKANKTCAECKARLLK